MEKKGASVFGVELRVALPAIAIVLLAIAGLAWVQKDAQQNARDQLLERFGDRAEVTGKFTAATLDEALAEQGPQARRMLSAETVSDQQLARFAGSGNSGQRYGVLADEKSRVLATSPSDLTPEAVASGNPTRQGALQNGKWFSGGIFESPTGLSLQVAAAFETPHGERVVSGAFALKVLDSFFSQFLTAATKTEGGPAYIVDRDGSVISSTEAEASPGKPLEDAISTALEGGTSGSVDLGEPNRFVAAPVSRTSLRVVLVSPTETLLSPADDAADTGWLLLALTALGLLAGVLALLRQLGSARDRARTNERLRDPLTGLANRTAFMTALAESSISSDGPRSRAVLAVNLDRFKTLNGSFGQIVGDRMLCTVAERLAAAFEGEATLSRIGGDEFALLTTAPVTAEQAVELAGRVRDVISGPFEAEGVEVQQDSRVGVALLSATARYAEAGMEQALAALDVARTNRSGCELYQPQFENVARDRARIESELRQALRNGELRLHTQPIVSLHDGAPCGVEALVRWQHPDRGLIPPAEFIPVAEQTGLITVLGQWVLDEACRVVGSWREAGIKVRLSVNLSPRQLSDPRLVTDVADALSGAGLEPASLCLEVTETAIFDNVALAHAQLEELKGLGVDLCLDDFGTGHSSLSLLTDLAVIDEVKIDRSFIMNLDRDREAAVSGSIISLCSDLGLRTVGEGVETPRQAAEVTRLGCDLAQGFYFARPKDPAETKAFLAAGMAEPPEQAARPPDPAG